MKNEDDWLFSMLKLYKKFFVDVSIQRFLKNNSIKLKQFSTNQFQNKMQENKEEEIESTSVMTETGIPTENEMEITLKVLNFLSENPKHLYQNKELLSIGQK